MSDITLPDYQELFGDLDFTAGDAARSVYSPAAYLADLLQLIDDVFDDADVLERRPDIARVPLDSENTYTVVPYLDIVNELLEREAAGDGGDAYALLRNAPHPLNLPFHLDSERVRTHLRHLRSSLPELEPLFRRSDPDRVARDVLGLSVETVELLVDPPRATARILRETFPQAGVDTAEGRRAVSVAAVMQAADLTGAALRELVNVDLSATALNERGEPETDRVVELFVNSGLGGAVRIDEEREVLVWSDPDAPIPPTWFQRVSRLVRLSKATGIGIRDLDRFLRTCCGNQLDRRALRTLALLIQLHHETDRELGSLFVLFGSVDTLGIGDETAPADPFNRMFNRRLATVGGARVIATRRRDVYVPRAFEEIPALRLDDLLSPERKEARRRVAQSLDIAERELTEIVEGFRTRAARGDDGPLGSGRPFGGAALSAVARIVTITELLEISPTDLYDLLDVLAGDPSIRRLTSFGPLLRVPAGGADCYSMLLAEDADDTLWLLQTLRALTTWMGPLDLSAGDLRLIAAGMPLSDDDAERAATARQVFFNGLVEEFDAVAFGATAFESDRIDARTSRLLHRLAGESAVASSRDHRLVRSDPSAAAELARRALGELDVLHADDFVDVAIADRLTDHLAGLLVLRGILDADGTISSDVPTDAGDFEVATDFAPLRQRVFDIVHRIDIEERAGSDEPPEYHVHQSDLEVLGLSDGAMRELYGNLVINGHLDEDGAVITPDFFADAGNHEELVVDSPLEAYSNDIHQFLVASLQRFDRPITIRASSFDGLGLSTDEVGDLLENLRFNGHLDADDTLTDPSGVRSVDVSHFDLALVFYPRRHAILAVLHDAVERHRIRTTSISRDDLFPLASSIASVLAQTQLAAAYCQDGRITEASRAHFLDVDNLAGFRLGAPFTSVESELLFRSVRKIINMADRYRLGSERLEPLGLQLAERNVLVAALEAELDARSRVRTDRVAYFSEVNNVVDFAVEGFRDDAADLFFMLHDVARETMATVDEVVAAIANLAAEQEDLVLNALQDHTELPADVVGAVAGHLAAPGAGVVEFVLAPVLMARGEDGMIVGEPTDHRFRAAFSRLERFAAFAGRLQLDAVEVDIAFHDQTLAEKFPEPLTLPRGMTGFDALVEVDLDLSVIDPEAEPPLQRCICLFRGGRFWAYAAGEDRLLTSDRALGLISPLLADLQQVDAAFRDQAGVVWVIAGTDYFRRDDEGWQAVERRFGRVHSNFADGTPVDASFTDHEGRTYLFTGDQYVRCSTGLETADPGYPKRIERNWAAELGHPVPGAFADGVHAAFQTPDGVVHLFRDDSFVSSDRPDEVREVEETWGLVRNNFATASSIDAASVDGPQIRLYSGDQTLAHSSRIETPGLRVDEGSLVGLDDLPDGFQQGIDAAFTWVDGAQYVFHEEQFAVTDDGTTRVRDVRSRWGLVRNTLLERGAVDAAFTGLDGRTYLFSGDQYVRYSGTNYTYVDEGYPRRIGPDWGGLDRVDAAFVLDGRTYLFGTRGGDEEGDDDEGGGSAGYVRYSTNDYSTPDEGYPQRTDDNWWNLPEAMVRRGFANPDSVFVALDGSVSLFSGGRFVRFDTMQRWWSEPERLAEEWDSIPFSRVDAAFTGKDGRTYVFGDERFVRYSDLSFEKVDDRYPKTIGEHWGRLRNTIDDTGSVDAALVVTSRESDGEGGTDETRHTYFFSGDQFFRYSNSMRATRIPRFVDEGYPRTIAGRLREEPRFAHLPDDVTPRVDAAFADDRTVYLFQGEHCLAVSDSVAAMSVDHLHAVPGCVFACDGAIYVEVDGSWGRISGLEGMVEVEPVELPRLLRAAPSSHRHEVDAAFEGLDGAAHVFRDGSTWNGALDAQFPASLEWGRVDNRVLLDDRVDAAFSGRDGKVYLFRGDQFLTYTLSEGGRLADLPRFADGLPRPIDEHWGGLSHVHLAYVRDGVTYLFERPDDEGRFRYVSYSGDDYSSPDSEPQLADLEFWGIPEQYVDEGFDRVDAVLVPADGDLLLVRGTEYVQYDVGGEVWTYPRPLRRHVPGLPLDNEPFGDVLAALTLPDESLVLFSEGTFVSVVDGETSDPEKISVRWGRTYNHFTEGGFVNAGFVHPDGTTFLFARDQFVRYSSSDYRFVDAGYPKSIVDDLRHEEVFVALTDEMVDVIAGHLAEHGGLTGVVADERTAHIVLDRTVLACSRSTVGRVPISGLGLMRNNLGETGVVDAGFVDDQGATYLFSGDQYVRYSSADRAFIDPGYPKSLPANDEGWPTLIEVDAVVRRVDGGVVLFSGETTHVHTADGLVERPVSDWGRVHNPFDVGGNVAVDAAFIAPDHALYVFKDDLYLRYSDPDATHVDEGFPRPIRDNWGDLPVGYERHGVGGGFVLDGRSYLISPPELGSDAGREYVRYSDPTLRRIDAISPQPFPHRWGEWNDFLLSDLHVVSRFKELQRESADHEMTLRDVLRTDQGPVAEPYAALADMFGWDTDEVKWLKRHNGFLQRDNRVEVDFDVELVLKMHDVFEISERIGSSPRELYESIWLPTFGDGDLGAVAERLRSMLAGQLSEADWKVLAREIHDELNVLRRDALLPFVLTKREMATARDLYEWLLIDPEVSSCSETSRVKEAITAVQLYLHRFFVALEDLDADGDTRRRLKRWWEWMKNYRVWEANRKVFLYPENYIRPELRDTKTPAFRTLEEDLQQAELDDAGVTPAYKKYIDHYTEVSRLTIAGGYVYDDTESRYGKRLVLFGRTKTDPRQYHYRTASFSGGDTSSARWEPWSDTRLKIESDKVAPVHAFGRVFVFWATVEEQLLDEDSTEGSVTVGKKDDDGDQAVSGNSRVEWVLRIWFSFHNLNGEWMPPQALDTQIDPTVGDLDEDGEIDERAKRGFQMREILPISDVELTVENSTELQSGPHENIVINCKYKVFHPFMRPPYITRFQNYTLTPELYSDRAPYQEVADRGHDVLRGLFPGETITPSRIVALNTTRNSTEGPWYAVDHKGAGFLVKPAVAGLTDENRSRSTEGVFPNWDEIGAAVQTPDGTSYFFDNDKKRFVTSGGDDDANDTFSKPGSTAARWGARPNKVRGDNEVDAAFFDPATGMTYVLRGDEYLEYRGSGYRYAENNSPRRRSRREGFPDWPTVGAAVAFADGRRLFFDNATQKHVSSSNFDDERPTALRFGTIPNSFTDPDTSKVTAAFEIVASEKRAKNTVYLVNGAEFVRYSGGLGDFVDAGYPKVGGAKALLEDLGFKRVPAGLKDVPIEAGFLHAATLMLAAGNGEVLVCDLSAKKMTRTKPEERFTAAYVNAEGELQALTDPTYDAVLVTGGRFILFRDGQYIRRNSVPASFDDVSWRRPTPIGETFGRQRTEIAATGVVDAALLDGPRLFLCSGGEYIRFTVDGARVRDFIDPGYPRPLADNPDGLPEWDGIGAAFRAQDGKKWFFRLGGGSFTNSNQLDQTKSISGHWGLFRNRLTETGAVTAAYVDGDQLYLFSGREYYGYTLGESGVPGRFMDEGYPKAVPIDDHEDVSAAFTVGDSVYLLTRRTHEHRYWWWWWWRPSEHRYARLDAGAEPRSVGRTELVRGSFGNLVGSLVDGIDAAINLTSSSKGRRASAPGTLRLVKGRDYVEFGLGEDDARPYEIAEGPFDLIRLTTSTGYVLNQELFSGGLPALLSTSTQQVDERPGFDPAVSAPTVIRYDEDKIRHRPVDSHLDFASANGIYYWEIFFHAPFLIAQSLSAGQRFEDAKRWYEYVYDPTEPGRYWTFLPFLTVDVEALVHAARGLLDELDEAGATTKSVRDVFDPVLTRVAGLEEEFRGQRALSDDDRVFLTGRVAARNGAKKPKRSAQTLKDTMADVRSLLAALNNGAAVRDLAEQLAELTYNIQRLGDQFDLLDTHDAQIHTYLDDPFDPHAVAGLRTIAYRKAIVMAYVDNLLDWGDQLFRRYSIESLSEARMLYVLAYDLLGTAPESLGTKVLPPARSYGGSGDEPGLRNPTTDYELLLELERELEQRTSLDPAGLPFEPTVHDTVVDSYFFIPANQVFFDYWDRVEDRLYKIRNCLNILGIAQPLPLFQPPLDPMAIVQAVAGGAGIGAAAAAGIPAIPHYRFAFMLAKARELAQKTAQYGNELLATLEKRDAEELSMMQYRQEATILAMTRAIREATIEEVDASLDSLRVSEQDAKARAAHYERLIAAGMLDSEKTQRDLMVAGAAVQYATVVLKAVAGGMYLVPEVTVGLFSFGAETGGVHAGDAISAAGDGLQTLGEALSMTGEAIGLNAAHERSKEDWSLQQQTANSEVQQIAAQIRGAEAQLRAARQELAVLDREIGHNDDLVAFMRDKFTNQQLYQWMAGRLSATFFQTFKLAHDLARYSEQAYRYERGLPAADVQFIQPAHWDGQRKGLLAGEGLGLDLDRMEQSFVETAERRLEISRNISLVELDPVAFLQLVRTGTCEFRLPESLFDADFPGHYCRQLKTVALSFETRNEGGQPLATLTQLSHQTLVHPDPKAVKFMLKPDGSPPVSIRSDWRPMQQIALSQVDEYEKNNGLFELRFDDDRYLPFEGTGAVSAWRLSLNGRRSSFDPRLLSDVVVNVKYTAVNGGDEFGSTVRGMLKPALTGELVDLAEQFPDEWQRFIGDPVAELTIPMRQELLPDITSSKIEALFTHFVAGGPPGGGGSDAGRHSMVVNGDDDLTLQQNRLTETPGLKVSRSGSTWTFRHDGDKAALTTIQLVVLYKASGS